MINKKLLFLSFFMFFVFLAVCIYADGKEKNFVTVLNGANFATGSGKNSYSFIGQPVVFATTEGMTNNSQSGFASVFYVTQSSSITFENKTSMDAFPNSEVVLDVIIKSTPVATAPDIAAVKYRIWQGQNVDWNDYGKSPEYTYEGTVSGKEVHFLQNINFTEGQEINYFKVYAQLTNGARRWSETYLVRLSSGLATDIKFTSPDELTGIAPLDPYIETTQFSLSFIPVTISLYKGVDDTGTPMYKVELDTKTVETYEIYDSTHSKVSYKHSYLADKYNKQHESESGFIKVPSTLDKNEQYTLKIIPTSGESGKKYTVTFKAVSDGVANIVTYPSPFNPKKQKIKIRYVLANERNVTIRLYDKAGKVVCKLVDGETRSAGTNEEEWDGRNYAGETLATGAYIVEIIAGSDRRYTALAIVGK